MLLALLLLPLTALASTPELICPEAKVSFQSYYFGGNTVTLEGEQILVVPWTGHESVTSARDLKAKPEAPEELGQLADNATFVNYQNKLYIQRDLLRAQEDGEGLVISLSNSKFSVFHCRSR